MCPACYQRWRKARAGARPRPRPKKRTRESVLDGLQGEALRKRLAEDVAAFEARGGEVLRVPPGATGHGPKKRAMTVVREGWW